MGCLYQASYMHAWARHPHHIFESNVVWLLLFRSIIRLRLLSCVSHNQASCHTPFFPSNDRSSLSRKSVIALIVAVTEACVHG